MRRMACTRRKKHEPRIIWCSSSVIGQVLDCVVAQIFGEVISGPIGTWGSDMGVVADYLGAELVGLCIEESVEAIKAARQWPAIKWSSWTSFCQWGDMPLSNHVVAVSVRTQHFSNRSSFFRNLAAISGEAAIEVG